MVCSCVQPEAHGDGHQAQLVTEVAAGVTAHASVEGRCGLEVAQTSQCERSTRESSMQHVKVVAYFASAHVGGSR